MIWYAHFFALWIACSRLRDSGERSFSKKKCEKRAGGGEIFLAATAPFPKSRASYFRFARFNMSALYYPRAWHRLRCGKRGWTIVYFLQPDIFRPSEKNSLFQSFVFCSCFASSSGCGWLVLGRSSFKVIKWIFYKLQFVECQETYRGQVKMT